MATPPRYTADGSGSWGPTMDGGRALRWLYRLVAVLGVVALFGASTAATTGLLLYQRLDDNMTRVPVSQTDDPQAAPDGTPAEIPRHFLLVGSDARDELDDEDRGSIPLGTFEGQRADTVMYVAISKDREAVSLVSLPRDLLVVSNGNYAKLTETFMGGPDQLIETVRENFDLEVNHYAQVSLGGFLDVVRVLGGVEICLDEPLVDPKSGANFEEPGCHDMSPEEALSYVRSRQGGLYDFDRMERQQRFLRAVLNELVQTRVLFDVGQLFPLVEEVASALTTDSALSAGTMLNVAGEARQVVSDGMPMTTVPAYPRRIDGLDYMIAYEPGARAMFEQLRAGEPLPERGSREERDDISVALYSGGRAEALDVVVGTLMYAGFGTRVPLGPGPTELDAGDSTVVYRLSGDQGQADWVAATLGAEVRDLPVGVDAPEQDVLVAVGSDALGQSQSGALIPTSSVGDGTLTPDGQG